jgi:hypothetical protein
LGRINVPADIPRIKILMNLPRQVTRKRCEWITDTYNRILSARALWSQNILIPFQAIIVRFTAGAESDQVVFKDKSISWPKALTAN